MAAVRKPASTEIAVQSFVQGGVDSVLRADPRALPAHTTSLRVVRRGCQASGTEGPAAVLLRAQRDSRIDAGRALRGMPRGNAGRNKHEREAVGEGHPIRQRQSPGTDSRSEQP